MIIEKSDTPGWYVAYASFGRKELAGFGESHTEAMMRCFEKINWYLYGKKE